MIINDSRFPYKWHSMLIWAFIVIIKGILIALSCRSYYMHLIKHYCFHTNGLTIISFKMVNSLCKRDLKWLNLSCESRGGNSCSRVKFVLCRVMSIWLYVDSNPTCLVNMSIIFNPNMTCILNRSIQHNTFNSFN